MLLKTVALMAATLFASAGVNAATVANGYISNVAFTGGRILVYVSGPRSGAAVGCCDRWELESATAVDQSKLAMVLTAYSLHRPVYVGGSGSVVGGANDTEGIGYFQTN